MTRVGDGITSRIMQKKNLVAILAVLAIAGAAASLYFSNRTPSIDFSLYGSAGAVAAEETAKLIGSGEIALYITEADETIPALKAQVDSFQKTATAKKIKVAVVEKTAIGGMSTELSPDQIAKTAAKHPGLKAIVTFVRIASLSNADTAAIKQKGVKLVAVSSYYPNYKHLLKAQLLHLAVVPQFGSPVAHDKKPETIREQFDQTYQLLTPENSADLP